MKHVFDKFFEKIGQYNRLVEQYKKAVETAPDHAIAYVNWGITLAHEGELATALEKFEKATQIAPNRPEGYTNWGVALAKLNRLHEAIEKFEKAAQIAPDAPNNYMLWGAALIEQGLVDEAREKYEKAIAVGSDNPEPYVNWGIALARIGQYPEAIKHFKSALAIHSHQPQVYFLWGVVLAETQDYENAIEKFKATLRYQPKHMEAYHFWSVALNRLGKYQESVEKARRALAIDPDKPEVYLNLGDALANLNRLDVAIANYRHALTLHPELAEAFLSWGIALCKLGKPQEGYEKFSKALSLDPTMRGVHSHWGLSLVQEKQFKEALPHLEKAALEKTADEPENVDVLLNWALTLIKTGRNEAGLEKLLHVEKMDPWNPTVHYLLGTHYLGLGNQAKAISHLEKALEAQADFEDAAINLSLALCEEGQTLEAVRRIRPLLRKSPDSAKINFFYGTVLYRHGDVEDAIAKYQKAIELNTDYLDPRIALGELYLKQNQLQKAEDELRAALALQATSLTSLYLLGCALMTKGVRQSNDLDLYREAQGYFKQTLDIAPDHIDAMARIHFLKGKLGGVDTMNQAFEASLAKLEGEARHLVLLYWSDALQHLGLKDFSEQKQQEARQTALETGITDLSGQIRLLSE